MTYLLRAEGYTRALPLCSANAHCHQCRNGCLHQRSADLRFIWHRVLLHTSSKFGCLATFG